MSNWNEGYTRRKQKQMLAEQIEREKSATKSKVPFKPPITDYYNSKSSINRLQKEREHEKRMWRIGYAIIAVVSVLGIYVIYLVATLH